MNNMKQLLRTIALKLLDYTEPKYKSYERVVDDKCHKCGKEGLVYNLKNGLLKCLECSE